MDQKVSRRLPAEIGYAGVLFIVIALIALVFNAQWAHAIAIVCAIIGVGLRIEAAIATSRLPDRS